MMHPFRNTVNQGHLNAYSLAHIYDQVFEANIIDSILDCDVGFNTYRFPSHTISIVSYIWHMVGRNASRAWVPRLKGNFQLIIGVVLWVR